MLRGGNDGDGAEDYLNRAQARDWTGGNSDVPNEVAAAMARAQKAEAKVEEYERRAKIAERVLDIATYQKPNLTSASFGGPVKAIDTRGVTVGAGPSGAWNARRQAQRAWEPERRTNGSGLASSLRSDRLNRSTGSNRSSTGRAGSRSGSRSTSRSGRRSRQSGRNNGSSVRSRSAGGTVGGGRGGRTEQRARAREDRDLREILAAMDTEEALLARKLHGQESAAVSFELGEGHSVSAAAGVGDSHEELLSRSMPSVMADSRSVSSLAAPLYPSMSRFTRRQHAIDHGMERAEQQQRRELGQAVEQMDSLLEVTIITAFLPLARCTLL